MFKGDSNMAVLSAELNAALKRLENIFIIKRRLNLEPNLALKVAHFSTIYVFSASINAQFFIVVMQKPALKSASLARS
jgi:hypothetical protein